MKLNELSMRAGNLSGHLSNYFNQEIKNIEHYVQETPEEILKLIKGTYLNV